jgi:hypothetical protein
MQVHVEAGLKRRVKEKREVVAATKIQTQMRVHLAQNQLKQLATQVAKWFDDLGLEDNIKKDMYGFRAFETAHADLNKAQKDDVTKVFNARKWYNALNNDEKTTLFGSKEATEEEEEVESEPKKEEEEVESEKEEKTEPKYLKFDDLTTKAEVEKVLAAHKKSQEKAEEVTEQPKSSAIKTFFKWTCVLLVIGAVVVVVVPQINPNFKESVKEFLQNILRKFRKGSEE